MTRNDKIEAICQAMEDWDLETLMDYAKDMRRERLAQRSDQEIEHIFQEDVVRH